MKKTILFLTAMFFVFGFFIDDSEAQARKQRVEKKQQARSKNSLRDRVNSVKKMLGGEERGLAAVKKPLEVRGQSRQLSMMLVLKNSKDKIQFVEVRENFEKEIMNTSY